MTGFNYESAAAVTVGEDTQQEQRTAKEGNGANN